MEKFKILLASLVTQQYNLRVLHWKVKGLSFDTPHKILDEYIDKFSQFIDQIAELMLTQGENPPSMNEIIETANIEKFNENLMMIDYNEIQVYKGIYDILNLIISKIQDCREGCEFSYIVSVLDEIEGYLQIEANYKTKQRIK